MFATWLSPVLAVDAPQGVGSRPHVQAMDTKGRAIDRRFPNAFSAG